MCDQIEAQILADNSALNATSADGKIIGGRTGIADDERLLKMEEIENIEKSSR
jgi:uncharacterized membrane protein